MGVQVSGADRVQDDLDRVKEDLSGQPLAREMSYAIMPIVYTSRQLAPVDRGGLRASILPDVEVSGRTVTGIVGSNVTYAPYAELGTKPHWVPQGVLTVWARRHGMPEAAVRFSIATFGTSKQAFRLIGTKGWRFLQRSIEQNAERVFRLLTEGVGRIVR